MNCIPVHLGIVIQKKCIPGILLDGELEPRIISTCKSPVGVHLEHVDLGMHGLNHGSRIIF